MTAASNPAPGADAPGGGAAPSTAAPPSADRNIARQERFWTRRASTWDHGAGNNPGLVKVVERVLAEADPAPGALGVDLGCGSGQVTLALSKRCGRVIGVDVSQKMIALLLANAAREGVTNVEGQAVPIERRPARSARPR